MTFDEAGPVLEAVAMAAVSERTLDLEVLAGELGRSAEEVEMTASALRLTGLALFAHEDEPEEPPFLTEAGSQYLRRRGEVSEDCLSFLPLTVDDLHGREALLRAGTILVDEFRANLRVGHGVEHAHWLVPPAFASAVDDALAVNMFAASVALLARLSAGEPAGCVAEEIVAVRLIEEAKVWLEAEVDDGSLTTEDAAKAMESLNGLFELFQDDDVLHLFAMEEPADAAVAGHDDINRQMGVVDQRVEAWFRPFGGVPATGHLDERPAADD